MAIARGSIWWHDFGDVRGSAPALTRPVLVVQSDSFNRSALRTCVVAALTSNRAHAAHPGSVFVPSSASALDRDSVVNVTQLMTVDRDELLEQVGVLPRYLLDEVDRGLRTVLDL